MLVAEVEPVIPGKLGALDDKLGPTIELGVFSALTLSIIESAEDLGLSFSLLSGSLGLSLVSLTSLGSLLVCLLSGTTGVRGLEFADEGGEAFVPLATAGPALALAARGVAGD